MPETRHSLVERMIGAMFLNIDVFEEVEHDRKATGQAATVVLMVAVASGIGASGLGLYGTMVSSVGALIDWVVWAGICYVVGDQLFGGKATWGEVLRTLGFAQTPGLLLLLVLVPILHDPVIVLVLLWSAVAGFIAVRQGLDIGNVKTLFTVILETGVVGFMEWIQQVRILSDLP